MQLVSRLLYRILERILLWATLRIEAELKTAVLVVNRT